MNNVKYRWILYFISSVIVATLCIQVYWNYKNYLSGKQQLMNDVQASLDTAVDNYYTQLAQQNAIAFITDSVPTARLLRSSRLDDLIRNGDALTSNITQRAFRDTNSLRGFSITRKRLNDSMTIEIRDSLPIDLDDVHTFANISSSFPFEMLTSKIVLSFSEDTLSLKKIDSLLNEELKRKEINISYGLEYNSHFNERHEIRPNVINTSKLTASTKSPFFYNDHSLSVYFGNITLVVLKKNLFGILLSLLLVSAVLFCLLYLLNIIKNQKQLAEVKNDLISNITHEFKTPIATIGVAMEGIQMFNDENDHAKNVRYAKISGEQVEKLNGMVEKLLETATLDSERLTLNFEAYNLVDLLRNASSKEAIPMGDKHISFESSEENIPYLIDVFHFENAINNIIDNAIKYGGDTIHIGIKKRAQKIEIFISDNGNSLNESHKKQIFEKFYRVPKGNTHDVKGFGIGLYYSKKIIEKHHGKIALHLGDLTTFKIQFPYEQ